MKPIGTFILIFSLMVAMLSGCAPASPEIPTFPPTEPEETLPPLLSLLPDMTVPPTEEPLPGMPQRPWQEEDWIGILHRETYSWTDSAGNRNRVTLDIPYLIPSCDMAYEFNTQMRYLNQQLSAETEEAQEAGTSPVTLSVSYQVYLWEDVLTVLLTHQMDADYTEYTAYSFDLEDLEGESTADLSEDYLKLDYPQFLMATNDLILARTQGLYGDMDPEDPFYQELLADISKNPTAMAQRQLFPGEGGQLMLVYPAPSMAGGAYYPTVEPFDVRLVGWTDVPSTADAYDYFFTLTLDAASPDSAACAALLRSAFEEEPEDFGEALALRSEAEISLAAQLLVQAYIGQTGLLEQLAGEWESPALRAALDNALKD